MFPRLIVIAIAVLVLTATALAQDAATTKALHDLFAREWEYGLQQSPTRASQLGDRRWNDRWRDVSLEAIKRVMNTPSRCCRAGKDRSQQTLRRRPVKLRPVQERLRKRYRRV